MINLLPPREKKRQRDEETWKIVIILGFLFLVSIIIFSLILCSINVFISGTTQAQKILYQQKEKEFQSSYRQTLQENLISFNQTLSQLDSFYQGQKKFTGILEEISNAIPSGAYLTNLLISPGSEEELNCSFYGFAESREILLQFKENLESEELFKEVYFPPSNWVQPVDIDFNVSCKIK